jgi:hypothetical protein
MLYVIDTLFWTAALLIQGAALCFGTFSNKPVWEWLQQQNLMVAGMPTLISAVLHTGSLVYRYVKMGGSRLRVRYIVYEALAFAALLAFLSVASNWVRFDYCIAPVIACIAAIFVTETAVVVFTPQASPGKRRFECATIGVHQYQRDEGDDDGRN